MKKAALLVLTLALALPSPALAHTNSSAAAEVLGFVNKCNDKVPFVLVKATCGTQTLSGLTGSTTGDLGKYSLTFHNASCVNGSPVTAVASVDSTDYPGSGTIGTYFFFFTKAEIDFQTGSNCPNPSVPEFGQVAEFLAIAGAAGAFLVNRKLAYNA